MTSGRGAGMLFVLGSAGCFATMGPTVRSASALGASIWALLAIRFGIAAVLWTLLACWPTPRRRVRLRSTDVRLLVAGIVVAVASYLEYEAYTMLPVAHVVVLLYLMPVWLAIGQRLLRSTKVGVRGLLALGISILGLSIFFPIATPGYSVQGLLLATAASILGAVFYWLLQDARSVSTMSCMLPVLGAATILTIPVALGQHSLLRALENPRIVLLGLLLGTVATVTGMALLFEGIRRLGAFVTAIVGATEPLYAAALGWILLGEALSTVQILGASLVVCSVVLIATGKTNAREFGAPDGVAVHV